jgi:hypothetical protein
MATILSARSRSRRVCNATCHRSTSTRCTCICGGRYHGLGAKGASARLAQDIIEGVWGPDLQRKADLYTRHELDGSLAVSPRGIRVIESAIS